MTPEVRRAGKEDVWTEQEYFAACLESKKRRLGLRSSIPQDECGIQNNLTQIRNR